MNIEAKQVAAPLYLKVTRDHLVRLHFRLQPRLPVWVVYRPVTREYPGKWIARMHLILPKLRHTRFTMTHDSLLELRAQLPPDLTFLGRGINDPPEIEEVWV